MIYINNLIKIFKVLSNQTRLRIIILLYFQKLYVCQICQILKLSQPTISKHLTKLKDIGIVIDYKKEQYVLYELVLENHILKCILEQIIKNKNDYPQIQIDIKRIEFKDTYLKNCNTSCNDKRY